MLLEFIATITAGVGAAGIVLAAQKLLRLPLPKWVMPACAGIAMLALTISLDYSWFARTEASLGPDKVTAMKVEKKQIWRPWTYVFPVTTRFIALDKAGARIDGATVETDMYLLARRADSAIVPVAFDCLLSRRADTAGLPEGDLSGATWFDMDQDDPILRTACDALR
ncbi:hypothetical protein [Celeribacter neptunius]|uniref:Uncharacterized protein n=1 Tax=Celeribacter neptunius TaxID=588602 RepID=A0A1I3UXP1_9RHOB|nr:hypothetical protein [Celeribacter neptunius]SFJ86856.1 hypothetical protein SAMN04487991_3217 [Celeribacter neptunius]